MYQNLFNTKNLLLLGFLTIFLSSCGNKVTTKDYKIIGYVAGWTGMPMSQVDMKKLTHINYAFANIKDGKVIFEKETDTQYIKELRTYRDQQNPDLKILVSIGGWVWSNHFSDVALTAKSRQVFCESAISFLEEHQLDGLDLDWEYPGQLGEDNVFRKEDKQNFTLLLKDLRAALDQFGKNKHFLLTIATGGSKAYIDNTELGEAQKYLDFINVMTYDLRGGYAHETGHHANITPSKLDKQLDLNITGAINYHLKAGVPAHKLVLGIPFYGRIWYGLETNDRNGLHVKTKTIGTIISYRDIQTNKTKTSGFQQFWDKEAQVPYLFSADSLEFISYETPKSIKIKVEYLKQKGLGGAMFWEYSDDYNNELIDALSSSLFE